MRCETRRGRQGGALATSRNTATRPGRGGPSGCLWTGHLLCRPSSACRHARLTRAFVNLLRPSVQRAESPPAAWSLARKRVKADAVPSDKRADKARRPDGPVPSGAARGPPYFELGSRSRSRVFSDSTPRRFNESTRLLPRPVLGDLAHEHGHHDKDTPEDPAPSQVLTPDDHGE